MMQQIVCQTQAPGAIHKLQKIEKYSHQKFGMIDSLVFFLLNFSPPPLFVYDKSLIHNTEEVFSII